MRAATILGSNEPSRSPVLRYPLAGHAPVAISLLVDNGHPLSAAPGGGLLPDNVAAGHDAFGKIMATLRSAA